MITVQLLEKAMNYLQYRSLLDGLLAQGKTTGNNQTAAYLDYAKLNHQRMNRLDKTTVLGEELKAGLQKISGQYIFLAITEGWCGDAAQNIPVFHAIEKEFPNLGLKLILRDENPEVMDQYLTNGARSIPKVICLDSKLEEKFVWGPRPAVLQDIVIQMKRENKSLEEKGLITQNWYNMDKTKSLQLELLDLLKFLQ